MSTSQRWSPELEGREVANGRNNVFLTEEPSHPASRYCGSTGRIPALPRSGTVQQNIYPREERSCCAADTAWSSRTDVDVGVVFEAVLCTVGMCAWYEEVNLILSTDVRSYPSNVTSIRSESQLKNETHFLLLTTHSSERMKVTGRSLLDTLSLLHYCGSCSKQCNNERASVSWA
ncbi:Hypothetical predicted protein [Scomber scombrus]|uniref:Uncharacterized protein n=1 Tax=Scomber scombrus TaxID=13677 RepID=A0AAV1MUZ9_SCOSC